MIIWADSTTAYNQFNVTHLNKMIFLTSKNKVKEKKKSR